METPSPTTTTTTTSTTTPTSTTTTPTINLPFFVEEIEPPTRSRMEKTYTSDMIVVEKTGLN